MVDSPGVGSLWSFNQMVESRSDHLDHVFHALAHPARREILRRIAREERSVTELAEPFDMSLEAVSKHVQVLERAKLLRRTRAGRVHRCRLGPAPLRDAVKVLEQLTGLWNKRLDSLERLLGSEED
jgi:DNA-binding transcriptional ArsR family regulator